MTRDEFVAEVDAALERMRGVHRKTHRSVGQFALPIYHYMEQFRAAWKQRRYDRVRFALVAVAATCVLAAERLPDGKERVA